MSGMVGRSAGFGRIGAHTRPSMYTPVHSRPPSAQPPALAKTTRSTAWKAAAAVAALVLAGVAAVVLLDAPAAPVPGPRDAGTAGPLDAEAERLGRSAFATHRPRG